jgi:hypothetical protein
LYVAVQSHLRYARIRRQLPGPGVGRVGVDGLFDFPGDGGAEAAPELVVHRVTGT